MVKLRLRILVGWSQFSTGDSLSVSLITFRNLSHLDSICLIVFFLVVNIQWRGTLTEIMKIHCFSSQSHQLVFLSNIQVLCVTHDSYLTFFLVGIRSYCGGQAGLLNPFLWPPPPELVLGLCTSTTIPSYFSHFFIYLLKLFYNDDFFFLQHHLFTCVISV